MKKKLFLLLYACVLYAFVHPAATLQAQPCAGLQVQYTTTESRCMATGSLSVTASGGSGNYNYKVSGPVNTHYTSANVISGLQAGTYSISVKDVNTGCVLEVSNAVVPGSYQDPRFQLSKTDVSCALNDGTITVNNLQNGRSPFSYTIIAPSPSGVGTVSTTGTFTNLVAGEYSVQLRDSCGGIQVRRITIENYTWWFENNTVTRSGCATANASIQLKDNKGNVNTSASAFAGFMYGVVHTPGDTSWFSSREFAFQIGNRRSVNFVAKDPCGTIHSSIWNQPESMRPTIGNVNTTNLTCTGFDAGIGGAQNLTSPVYSLYRGNSTELVGTNATGTFTNLAYGAYCLNIRDNCYDTTIVRCFNLAPPALSLAATPIISHQTCATFTATITSTNFNAPNYCLYDSEGRLVTCNEDGVFNNVPYGRYCIRATDACSGQTLERCFEAYKPLAVLTGYTLSGQSCTSFNVSVTGTNLQNPLYCLYDDEGRQIMCNETGIFEGIGNGSYCIRAISCGDTTAALCFSSGAPDPYMGSIVAYNKTCSAFTIGLTGETNISNAVYRLYDASDNLVATNSTGTFENLPYGSYCIRVTDGCKNTTLQRCIAESRPVPSVNATITQLNSSCSTFTARVEGQQNLTDPVYYLKDAHENVIAQNGTGLFPNLAYGTYLIDIHNTCYDTVIRRSGTFSFNYNISVSSSRSCTWGNTDLRVTFTNGVSPYMVNVYGPDMQLVRTQSSTGSVTLTLPALGTGQQYTVTGIDACGRSATRTVTPNASVVTKSIIAQSKCPSSTWQNGSGNLVVSYTSNYNAVTPSIIKKNGAAFTRAHSSQSGTTFTFSDLEPATYIVQYAMQGCSNRMYDTFALQPYSFPTQGLSAIYQCDNNSFSLGADIAGGVGPYTYQIIGSIPETPSIVSAEQSSPIFNINTGTVYSLVRLRSMDACGNATLNDVSVLPLQNIIMKASNDCFFESVTLSVDTIPNARYQWYKKTGANDSILLTTNTTYNLPFMRPEDVGTYVCKITVNDGCMVRLASYTLDGDCGHQYLAGSLQLKGKKEQFGYVLNWQGADAATLAYTVERKAVHESKFIAIATTRASALQGYSYTDAVADGISYQYRIKATAAGGKVTYSNTVTLQGGGSAPVVYPNPVDGEVNVVFNGKEPAHYRIALHNLAGQAMYQTELKNITTYHYQYRRSGNVKSGIYLMKITNLRTGEAQQHKILFR